MNLIALAPEIVRSTGGMFSYTNPVFDENSLADIAIGLSNVCRFSGQIPDGKYLSVLTHSLLGMDIFLLRGDPESALYFALHDASEAYTGDISSPLKKLLTNFREIEDNITEKCELYYRVKHTAEVKEMDIYCFEIERDFLFDGILPDDREEKLIFKKHYSRSKFDCRKYFHSTVSRLLNEVVR